MKAVGAHVMSAGHSCATGQTPSRSVGSHTSTPKAKTGTNAIPPTRALATYGCATLPHGPNGKMWMATNRDLGYTRLRRAQYTQHTGAPHGHSNIRRTAPTGLRRTE